MADPNASKPEAARKDETVELDEDQLDSVSGGYIPQKQDDGLVRVERRGIRDTDPKTNDVRKSGAKKGF